MTWNIKSSVDDSFVPSTQRPSVLYWRLAESMYWLVYKEKCQCKFKKTLALLWYAWWGSVQWWCFMSKFTTTCSQQCKLEQSHGMAFLKCYCEIHRTGRVVYFLDICNAWFMLRIFVNRIDILGGNFKHNLSSSCLTFQFCFLILLKTFIYSKPLSYIGTLEQCNIWR